MMRMKRKNTMTGRKIQNSEVRIKKSYHGARGTSSSVYSLVSKILNTLKSEVRTVMGGFLKRRNHSINKNPQPATGNPQLETRNSQSFQFRGLALIAVLVIAVSLCFVFPGTASADTAGPNSGSSAVNEAPLTLYKWLNPANVFTSDNANAAAYSIPNLKVTNNLFITGFGFAIPGGSTIDGIEVAIERREGGRSSVVVIRDNLVTMIKGGVITGDNKASGADWPGTDQTATYGSNTDLWGEVWTPGDINAGDFGVAISAKGISSLGFGNEHAFIDHITITVFYSLAGGCTTNSPLVEILDAPQTITADNGSVNYNVRITNLDVGGACTNPLAITLATGDSNGNFTSSIPTPVNLAPGTNTTVTLTVNEVSATSGETTTTTVTASAAGHPNGTDNVLTTFTLAPTCTVNIPTLQVTPASQAVVAGSTVDYTVTVTNNDTAACAAATFTINVVSDSNNTDFNTPSTVNPVSIFLNPGQSDISILKVSADVSAPVAAMNDTEVGITAAGHVSPPNVTVTTKVGNPLIHNSANTGSGYWGGDWGVSDTSKYGKFVCGTCHMPRATNIKNIKGLVLAPNSPTDDFPGSTVIFQSTSSPDGFGDDEGGHTTSTKICEVCHSQTAHHRYDTTGQTDGLIHNNRADCMACHPHNQGFKPAGDCDFCHGFPPVEDVPNSSSSDGKSGLVDNPAATGSVTAGAHDRHVNDIGLGCETCHTDGMPATPINDFNIQIGFDIFGIPGGDYDGRALPLPNGYTYAAGNPQTNITNTGTMSCAGIYCHGATLDPDGGTDITPEWGDPLTGQCGTCHGATAANPPVRGSHMKHTELFTGTGHEYECSLCHIDPTVDNALHVNNKVRMFTVTVMSRHLLPVVPSHTLR
jgi:predicted CxxxxCH...CXXCH cytochrome family protein